MNNYGVTDYRDLAYFVWHPCFGHIGKTFDSYKKFAKYIIEYAQCLDYEYWRNLLDLDNMDISIYTDSDEIHNMADLF